MNKKLLKIILAIVVIAILGAAEANARPRVSISFGYNTGGYYGYGYPGYGYVAAPVYYPYSAPVYCYPQTRVYYYSTPVYYAPRPVYRARFVDCW